MKQKPLSLYPGTELRREIERIGERDHNRPVSHVGLIALKAFAVLFKRNPAEALKLAAEFDEPQKKQ